MTYLPNFDSSNCIVVDNLNNGYIRVYEKTPFANSTINYIDYFIGYDYITRTGSQTFTNYNYSMNCQSHSNFTTDFYYRVDFQNIIIIFFVIVFIVYYLGFKPISRIFGRWLKL